MILTGSLSTSIVSDGASVCYNDNDDGTRFSVVSRQSRMDAKRCLYCGDARGPEKNVIAVDERDGLPNLGDYWFRIIV